MPSDAQVGDLAELAAHGRSMVRAIRRAFRGQSSSYPDTALLTIAVAQGLTWTRHAVGRDDFYAAAIAYLEEGRERNLNRAVRHFQRFGPQALSAALRSWRTLLREAKEMARPNSVANLLTLQRSLFDVGSHLATGGFIHGVGPWLFCAPFKILLCSNARFLKHPNEHEVLQPLGIEVVRGIRKLRKRGYFASLQPGMLEEEEGGLVEGMATSYLVHGACVPLAADCGTSVSEFNTGLWWLGKEG